jgi:hypothetical protein
MLQGIFLIHLKPSYAVAPENQLHKPPEEQGQVARRLSYGNYNDAANLSKPSVWSIGKCQVACHRHPASLIAGSDIRKIAKIKMNGKRLRGNVVSFFE